MSADQLDYDLYEVLHLTDDKCTKQMIVAAFRQRALQCHPDKNPRNPNAHEEFIKITKALTILSDERSKVIEKLIETIPIFEDFGKAAYDYLRRLKKEAEAKRKTMIVAAEQRKKQEQAQAQAEERRRNLAKSMADERCRRQTQTPRPAYDSASTPTSRRRGSDENRRPQSQTRRNSQPSPAATVSPSLNRQASQRSTSPRSNRPIRRRPQQEFFCKMTDEPIEIRGPKRRAVSLHRDEIFANITGERHECEFIGDYGNVTIGGENHNIEILGDYWTIKLNGKGHAVTLCGKGGIIVINGKSHTVKMHGDNGIVEISGQDHRLEVLGDDLVFRKVKIFKDFELKFRLKTYV